MAVERRYPKDELEFARAVTFFDAIFAFAVTLLITTVDDFSREAWSSLPALWAANGQSLLAFTISFAVVVSFWRASHHAVTGLAALTPRIITLNCCVMFGVVLIPFATEAQGKVDLPLPVAVYAVVISATSILTHYADDQANQAGLGGPVRTGATRVWYWSVGFVLPAVFLGSIPFAYAFSPKVAQYSWILLILLIPLAERLRRRFDPDGARGDE